MSHGEQNIAPDWAHVHFDVACARCGHDLYGHAEPTCPACKLEFDWAVAVPVHKLICADCDYQLYGLSETRCPECGSEFTWEGALDHYRRLQKPLFEYRWRVEPVRSLVRTWWWALWPPKIWSEVDIHDPPKVRPLVVTAVIAFVLNSIVPCVYVGTMNWLLVREIWAHLVRRGKTAFFPPPTLLGLAEQIGSVFLTSIPYLVGSLVALWSLLCLAAMTAFPESMAMCRVRYVHIVRIWGYATPLFIPFYLVATCMAFLIAWAVDQDAMHVLEDGWFLLAVYTIPLVHVVWSTWWAYKKYIQMRHSFWVAVSVQAMAVLATYTIYMVLHYELGLL